MASPHNTSQAVYLRITEKCVVSLELGAEEKRTGMVYIDGSTKTWSLY
jgi:hypothetical protein